MLTHAELIRRSVSWLKSHHKCSIVYADMSTIGTQERPDAIGWYGTYSRLVECKTSRSDFLKDKKKYWASQPESGMGMQRWYTVPADLVRPEEVPAWWGLAYVYPKKIVVVKQALDRSTWDHRGEISMLTSAIKRIELGSHFEPKTGHWESYETRNKRQETLRLASDESEGILKSTAISIAEFARRFAPDVYVNRPDTSKMDSYQADLVLSAYYVAELGTL